MKPLNMMLAGMLLLVMGCSQETAENQVEGTAPVTVRFNDFSTSMSGFDDGPSLTRAPENPATYDGVGAMQLAFYDVNGTKVYHVTQIKSNSSTYETFGQFKADLPIGNYTMVALGYYYSASDAFSLTSPTEAVFTSDKPRETFCKTQSVRVTNTAPVELDVTLSHIGARLTIQSTDNASAGVAKMRTTFGKGGKSFSPTTGLALTDTGFSQTQSASTNADGKLTIYSFPFLAADTETMDVTLEAFDADNNLLFTKVVPDVTFKCGYATTIKGTVFTVGSSSFGFMLNSDWGDGGTVTF